MPKPPKPTINGKPYTSLPYLLECAHQDGLVGIETELIQLPNQNNAQTCIVHAKAWIKDHSHAFTGIGDANPTNTKTGLPLIRMAESRAIVRALRWATNNADPAEEEFGPDPPPTPPPGGGVGTPPPGGGRGGVAHNLAHNLAHNSAHDPPGAPSPPPGGEEARRERAGHSPMPDPALIAARKQFRKAALGVGVDYQGITGKQLQDWLAMLNGYEPSIRYPEIPIVGFLDACKPIEAFLAVAPDWLKNPQAISTAITRLIYDGNTYSVFEMTDALWYRLTSAVEMHVNGQINGAIAYAEKQTTPPYPPPRCEGGGRGGESAS